jgi:hypothetical protein
MPLWKTSTPRSFKHNVRAEYHAGKPIKQAVAIAYSTKRRAEVMNRAGGSRIPKDLKIEAHSFERYRASAAERRQYGGSTVTKFYVFFAKDRNDASKWKTIMGYGATPGERKTDAIRRSGFLEEQAALLGSPALPRNATGGSRYVDCPDCHGTGLTPRGDGYDEQCWTCGASGRVSAAFAKKLLEERKAKKAPKKAPKKTTKRSNRCGCGK